jgi:hypothetical protein
VRAHRVIIIHVARKDVAKVLLARHHNVVQAFPTDRADQPFGVAVLPWRACRSRMIANAKRANSANEYAAVASISIMDQIARNLLPPTGGRQLIGNSFCGAVRRDSEPQNLSPTVPHDQQSIQQPKGHRRNDKQVHRRDTVSMIAQEGLPALRRRPSSSRHIFGRAGLAYVDAELDQFAVYARCAPQRVGNAHLPDQLPDRRDATAPRYQTERWQALHGPSETAGRPSPVPTYRRLTMALARACPVAAQ